jgi:hypothetical protein
MGRRVRGFGGMRSMIHRMWRRKKRWVGNLVRNLVRLNCLGGSVILKSDWRVESGGEGYGVECRYLWD